MLYESLFSGLNLWLTISYFSVKGGTDLDNLKFLKLALWWKNISGVYSPFHCPPLTYKNRVEMVNLFRPLWTTMQWVKQPTLYLRTTDNSYGLCLFFRSIRAILNICAFLSFFTVVIQAAPQDLNSRTTSLDSKRDDLDYDSKAMFNNGFIPHPRPGLRSVLLVDQGFYGLIYPINRH